MASRRSILAAALAAILFTVTPPHGIAADLETGARAFIESLSEDAIRSLTNGSIPRAERIENFRRLFNDSFAVEAIGQWVLGRYWREATESERTEYLALFEDLMIATYVDRFASYTGDNLRIDKVLANGGDNVTVYSLIPPPPSGGPPVRVDWRVSRRGDQFKILDVVVEGTSMSTTLRSEFGSVIRREGGTVAGLLKVLKAKTDSLK